MKGVIFKHFEAFVVETFGDEAFETVLERTSLQTELPFVGPATYPDSDLFALVESAVELSGLPAEDAVFAFGKFLFPRLAAGAPQLVEHHTSLRTLLLELDRVIHVEVRKILPEAETPRILCRDLGPERVDLTYRSSRQLCALLRGLLAGGAEALGEEVLLDETACMRHGAEACTFELTIRRKEARDAA